jgi:hypothetical protein
MGGAELRVSYENYYYDISYLLFVTDRRAAKYPFSSHSYRLWLVLYPAFGWCRPRTSERDCNLKKIKQKNSALVTVSLSG